MDRCLPHTTALPLLPPTMAALCNKIMQSTWWACAACCTDRHYNKESGIMLAHHLLAVKQNVERLFHQPKNLFLARLLAFAGALGLHKERTSQELQLVALLHDIGKIEDDKSQKVLHPLLGVPTIKRHSVVSLVAAIDILGSEPALSSKEKELIYSIIEEHDVSYGLYCECKATGTEPPYARWQQLNNAIHPQPGIGLLNLLLFKLADTHGHGTIDDVTWFFQTVHKQYFQRHRLYLPLPHKEDIR